MGNLIFKLTYCDGGRSAECIGFNGICSPEVIARKMNSHSGWCRRSECAKFADGSLSYAELLAKSEDSGYSFCIESVLRRRMIVYAGSDRSGKQRRILCKKHGIKEGSLCVLTTFDPHSNEKEEDRYVIGAFLIEKYNEGNPKSAGYVQGRTESIFLTPDEAQRIKLWKYYRNPESSDISWGSGLYRVKGVTDELCAQILLDIALVKTGKHDEQAARKLLMMYCTAHHIDPVTLPDPCGALAQELEKHTDFSWLRIAFREGLEKMVSHKKRERDPILAKAVKDFMVERDGFLSCEMCGRTFEDVYAPLRSSFFEAHHLLPLKELTGETVVTIQDLRVVCPNCHSVAHLNEDRSFEDLMKLVRKNIE